MNIGRIVEKIQENTAGGDIANAVTNNGNPSVAYLPGSFTNMKNSLRSLSVVKKQWDINVIENEGTLDVNFEDALSISVPRKAFEEFNTKVINVIDNKQIDLTSMVNEARTEMVHKLYSKLNRLFTANLRTNPPIRKTLITMNYWLSLFNDSVYLPMNSTVIQLNDFDNEVRSLIKRIENIYEDDIGNLEMLSSAISQKRPLGAFEPFSEYDYLIGTRIRSVYNGIETILELTVSNSLVMTQSMYIESKSILAELEAYKSVKVLNSLVFPVGQAFNPSIFKEIKDLIDGLEEN